MLCPPPFALAAGAPTLAHFQCAEVALEEEQLVGGWPLGPAAEYSCHPRPLAQRLPGQRRVRRCHPGVQKMFVATTLCRHHFQLAGVPAQLVQPSALPHSTVGAFGCLHHHQLVGSPLDPDQHQVALPDPGFLLAGALRQPSHLVPQRV